MPINLLVPSNRFVIITYNLYNHGLIGSFSLFQMQKSFH